MLMSYIITWILHDDYCLYLSKSHDYCHVQQYLLTGEYVFL